MLGSYPTVDSSQESSRRLIDAPMNPQDVVAHSDLRRWCTDRDNFLLIGSICRLMSRAGFQYRSSEPRLLLLCPVQSKLHFRVPLLVHFEPRLTRSSPRLDHFPCPVLKLAPDFVNCHRHQITLLELWLVRCSHQLGSLLGNSAILDFHLR